ncbi:MAG: hypothetical protein HY810_03315 [Candidatus Omnitrophica bacterium]|nr:hypothetical protein [Candidatus Omnitrophota bacterium]
MALKKNTVNATIYSTNYEFAQYLEGVLRNLNNKAAVLKIINNIISANTTNYYKQKQILKFFELLINKLKQKTHGISPWMEEDFGLEDERDQIQDITVLERSV